MLFVLCLCHNLPSELPDSGHLGLSLYPGVPLGQRASAGPVSEAGHFPGAAGEDLDVL